MSDVWIVALFAPGGSLVGAGATMPWYGLLAASIVGVAAVVVMAGGSSRLRSGGSREAAHASTGEDAALETLKEQYAVGEIGDAEFERRLEALLANETISDVERRRNGGATVRTEAEQEPEPARHHPAPPQKCRQRGTRHHGRH